jgi:tRNA A37 threonylcarbamoyladenosine dehydratase
VVKKEQNYYLRKKVWINCKKANVLVGLGGVGSFAAEFFS